MKDVTQILSRIEQGDPSAADQLLPLVYHELRKLAAAKMAQESPDHTLQATALVHEAYLRLLDVERVRHWDSRGHFFAAAAEAMRRILVESARRKRGPQRGGDRQRAEADLDRLATPRSSPDVLAVDAALKELAEKDPPVAKLVELRYFGGLTLKEAAAALGISRRTADSHWAYAKAWLPSLHTLGVVLFSHGLFDQAIEPLERAIQMKPSNTLAATLLSRSYNNLAWLLATCPQEELRDADKAVEHAKRAVALDPDEEAAWNTLGVAQYRAGDFDGAVASLEKSIELDPDGTSLPYNAFFLAMAHWQLGEQDEARSWYDKAVQWMNEKKSTDEELLRFRAEAEALWGGSDDWEQLPSVQKQFKWFYPSMIRTTPRSITTAPSEIIWGRPAATAGSSLPGCLQD